MCTEEREREKQMFNDKFISIGGILTAKELRKYKLLWLVIPHSDMLKSDANLSRRFLSDIYKD